jgi:hypothetical protein
MQMKKERSHYVFGAALAGMALGGIPALVNRAHAALVTAADFTFETSASAFSTSVTGATIGPIIAESGTGSAYGVHATATTVYSGPAGNGSPHSLSSNHWLVGDYYKFSVPTSGIENILMTFDQIGSGSGPASFTLAYSIDGSTFSSFTNYTLPYSSASSFWGSAPSAANSVDSFSFDLSGVTGLNDNSNAAFELIDNSSSIAFSSASVGTGGTDRVDNVVISGSAVPEPASVSLLTAAAAGLMLRRRQS